MSPAARRTACRSHNRDARAGSALPGSQNSDLEGPEPKRNEYLTAMHGPPGLAAEMMKPYGGAIKVWEVGKDVGNVRNNAPELLERVALVYAGGWQSAPSCRRRSLCNVSCAVRYLHAIRRGGFDEK